MTPDPDDDALSWGDERDPTYVESAQPGRDTQRRQRAERPVVDESEIRADEPGDGAAAASTSSAMLLALGILAGAYLLYTAGWFMSATRTIAVPVGAFDVLMYQLREWLSVAAPALWFGTTLLLTRTRKPSARLLWLILGAIVLIPVPFVLGE